MKKNSIQFQKGFSLRDFMKRYGIVKQCAKALFEARWPSGFQCPSCGGDHYPSLSKNRTKINATIKCLRRPGFVLAPYFDPIKCQNRGSQVTLRYMRSLAGFLKLLPGRVPLGDYSTCARYSHDFLGLVANVFENLHRSSADYTLIRCSL
jgi:hypothetical protein